MGLRFAVLASGSGTNLQALIDASIPGLAVVISDVVGCGALTRAEKAGVPTAVIDYQGDRAAFTTEICDVAESFGAGALILAGFMRVLGPEAMARFPHHILNIHPSLLPSFPGKDAVARALDAGVAVTGVTVHLVDEAVDHGPIIAQRLVPIRPEDDVASLHARIQIEEHDLYPRIVRDLVEHRLTAADGDRVRVRRAIVSVSDKAGLAEFCRRLTVAGVEIVSSGGSAAFLAREGVAVTLVSDVTGAAEMLGGRVKTLHPNIHAGILARLTDPEHRADLQRNSIEPFELVVVNLYPFEATVADPETTFVEAIERIDIGGPALIRAAAKNHDFVGVVTSPDQYQLVANEVEAGGLNFSTRQELARQAFFQTAAYDAAISRWLEKDEFPPARMAIALERVQALRYGENPHQEGAIYRQTGASPWWLTARIVQGKEMSFNNYLDAEAAWRLVADFDQPAAAIIKHTNPCGVAVGADLEAAFSRAWDCDPLSAFGGVVALNRPLDEATANAIADHFVEIVIAPEVPMVGGLRNTVRVIEAPFPHRSDLDLRRVEDGLLIQGRDTPDSDEWVVVSARHPDDREWSDLRLAWVVAAHAKSNSVVLVNDGVAVGVGAGDQSRIGATERAVAKAGSRARGAVAGSDAFFPFPDAIERLVGAGVTAVVAPAGSKNDAAVVAAANDLGLALVRAGRRHFRH